MTNQADASLEEVFIASSSTGLNGRRAWKLRLNRGQPTWAAIFLDAELYLERVKALTVLRHLQVSGDAEALLAVFISSESAVARHSDYTCDANYARFIAQDVTQWLSSTGSRVDPARTLLVGLSLSGLAAAYTTLNYPNQFSAAICQSPSFWWENERFRESVPESTGLHPAFWISVGDQETEHGVVHPPSGLLQKSSQLRACELACHALRAAKHNVSFRVFNGGHDPALWKEDLALALGWATQALEKPHELRQPQTQDEWEQYHRIRRRVLWERRGLIGVYDENHPDERLPGRYPFLLMLGTAAIGVLRIDIEGNKAIFRRVAVREDMQHAGNGRVLLNLAEKFARANGCDHLYSFVAPDAVGFYEKCGFQRDPENPASRDHVPMEKRTR